MQSSQYQVSMLPCYCKEKKFGCLTCCWDTVFVQHLTTLAATQAADARGLKSVRMVHCWGGPWSYIPFVCLWQTRGFCGAGNVCPLPSLWPSSAQNAVDSKCQLLPAQVDSRVHDPAASLTCSGCIGAAIKTWRFRCFIWVSVLHPLSMVAGSSHSFYSLNKKKSNCNSPYKLQ